MIGQTGVRTIHDGAYCVSEQADQPARALLRPAMLQSGARRTRIFAPAALVKQNDTV
jgi:hypothetical protein